ncbi:hypothetical protein BDZ91DRAFT_413767 [Kalaharituber pfeilii]|nr:hypothetical protein BDZ91DRAFT_413767 [Kalaharituber pfeilii]
MIASVPLYGMHNDITRLPNNLVSSETLFHHQTHVWAASFTLPPHLKRPSRDRSITFSLSLSVRRKHSWYSETMDYALVTTNYTLPSTEMDLVMFLSQLPGEQIDGVWSLRPDADGYAVLLANPPECTWYCEQPAAAGLDTRGEDMSMPEASMAIAHPRPPITELHKWFSVAGLTSYPEHHALVPSHNTSATRPLVALQMPVFCSTGLDESSTARPWTELAFEPTEEREGEPRRRRVRGERTTHMATLSPWYVTLKLRHGNPQLPFSTKGMVQVRAVGDGWLVYQWTKSRPRTGAQYRTVLVWFD